jgi:hypothetical protein
MKAKQPPLIVFVMNALMHYCNTLHTTFVLHTPYSGLMSHVSSLLLKKPHYSFSLFCVFNLYSLSLVG